MPTATQLTRIVVLVCWCGLLPGLLSLSRTAAAQNVFHVEVNLVNLGFVARDSQGKLVPNLTADDIELFEDAVPQKIHSFAKSTDLPLTLALIVDASGSQDHFGKQHQKDLELFLKEVLRPQIGSSFCALAITSGW